MFERIKAFFREIEESGMIRFFSKKHIDRYFSFLTEEYDLQYKYREFNNCFGGYWYVEAYSFYNESGCFTLHYLPQRDELDIYHSKSCVNDHQGLLGRHIGEIEAFGDEAWTEEKNKHKGSDGYVLYSQTLAELIKKKLDAEGEIFGVKVNKK